MGNKPTKGAAPEQRALAHLFHDPDMPSPAAGLIPGGWIIRCECCGFQAKAKDLETAGAEFFQHMFFGQDTSLAHLQYASGIGRRRLKSLVEAPYYGL
jgi:hypothetical protein